MKIILLKFQGYYQQTISGYSIFWMAVVCILGMLSLAFPSALEAMSMTALEKSGDRIAEMNPLGAPIIYVDADSEAMNSFSVVEAGGSQIKYYYVEYHDFNSNILASIVLEDPTGSFSIAFDDEMEFSDSLTVEFSMYTFKTIMIKYAPTTEGPHSATIKHTGDIDSGLPEPVFLSIEGNTPVGLPIDLLSFRGKLDQESFVLDWVTASETNNAYFEIEMMQDPALGFKEIGRIDSRFSNSNTLVNYQFRYPQPERTAITYFRLKQVDIDQTFSYSPTIAIRAAPMARMSLQVVPNPIGTFSELHITSAAAGNLQISVTDLNGSPLFRQQVEVHKGTNKISLPLPQNLPAGLYLLTAGNGAGISRLKLIKD